VSLLRRKPPAKRHPLDPVPDERIFGRHYHGPSPAKIGLLVALIAAAAIYLAFAKHIPFTGHGYELHATFENAATLRKDSPVRIAGVNVGKVESVSSDGNVAEATFTVSDEGLPIHRDATVTIRPRLFLEGNFFLDLRPGSPSAPELSSGATIPATQTATAVQLDQILTSLQSGSRANLQRTLEGFGTALTHQPSAAEDVTQDPDVQGKTAAQAINESFRYGGQAGRDTAITNEALLGEHPHDLSALIRAQRDVFAKLDSNEESLKGLITNFNVTAGALAAESANLSRSIRQLAPTLEEARPSLLHLSAALPPLRALARELRPGIRELPGTIRAGSPWLVQARKLLHERELGGDARFLADAAPGLARTVHSSLRLFPQVGLTSRCVSDVLIPTGNVVIDNAGGAYPFSTGQPNIRELFYGTVQLAGESQGFDGNGSYVRFQAGGGPQLVRMANPNGGFQNESLWAHNISAPLGTRPALPAGGKPPFRMDVPCYQSTPPDLNGPAGAVGPPAPEAVP
jgi:phospholipid/cholesterol/gamma-HCH transport system substrate-binding protein